MDTAPIQHVLVLALENRSFDHLFGYFKSTDPRIVGLSGAEANLADPNQVGSRSVAVTPATSFVISFDPGHEFVDVQIQLYGPTKTPSTTGNPPTAQPRMTGFLYSARQAANAQKVDPATDGPRIMECFRPEQLPVLSTLAREFAIFNFWHSSIPGPTWPNRFFFHAATSGGLTDSPSTDQIIGGFSFTAGTIYDKLKAANKTWRIYHGGLPQAAGISSLRLEYVDPLTKHFRELTFFTSDVQSGDLADYTFIEPTYDTGHNYQDGDSMHPLNDIRKGEALVKTVYETLRNSSFWANTLLILTFDEHGGFYDHVPPPKTQPTGDDTRYASASHPFAFDRLGVRVPAVAVSAWTPRGAVIGSEPVYTSTIFDHTSILATVEGLFGLAPLSQRDKVANGFDSALSLPSPRVTATDAPSTLPEALKDGSLTRMASVLRPRPSATLDTAPLSLDQRTHLALALSCDMLLAEPRNHPEMRARHDAITTQADAASYLQDVESRIHTRRAVARLSPP